MNTQQPFSIGNCQISAFENKLFCADKACILQPKFIELLTYLVACYPNAVSREQLIENVWDGNQYVGEKALTNAIWHLRKSFKELDPDNTYIETLRKTGYRLVQKPIMPNAQNSINTSSTRPKYIFAVVMAIVVLLFAGVWGYNAFSDENKPLALSQQAERLYDHVETITTSPGRELFPAISSDSHFLAYSWRRPGHKANLYLRDLHLPEQAAIALTDTPFIEGRAVFSSDLTFIYYYRRISGQGCEVIQQNIASGNTTILGKCGNKASTDIDINALGTKLVYISEDDENNLTQLNLVDLTSSPYTITQIPCISACQYNDESVVFSPDATQLVVSRNLPTGFEELFLIDIKTGNAKQLTTGFIDMRGVDWHPSKAQLVFSGVKKGKRQGYFYNLKTQQMINARIDGLSYPEFASDGSLYFHQWNIDSALMRLEVNNAVASSPFPVLSSHFSTRFPNYNKTRNKLAFVSNESGSMELWTAKKDGTSRKQLTNLNANIYHPVWSPDGDYIAFVASHPSGHALYLYDFNKQTSELLPTGFSDHGKPSWAADSKSVLVSDDQHVYRFDLNGNKLEQAIDSPTLYAYENKQGALVFANQATNQLWIKDPDSQTEQPLVSEINLSNHNSWYFFEGDTLATSRIYYFNVKQGDYRLSYYDFSTKSHHDVIRLPERAFSRTSGLTYISNTNWLVYSSYKSPQIDIKRINQKYLP